MTDTLWETIRKEAEEDIVRREPMLASFFYQVILNHKHL
jgi:hypothetical protein